MSEKIKWSAVKKEFNRFCNDLKIETKEFGIVSLGKTMLGSQIYFVDEVFDGLDKGVHYSVVLKARQMGISTIMLALDLFWHFKFPGTQGTLATDTEENREMFRTTLTLYMEGLPPGWKQPVKTHNRTQVTLANRSRMVYQVAGTRKNVGFGAGKAIMFMHATEIGKWGDVDLPSLEASLAENNPHRLYVWESTAYGFNQFYDMWETAKTSTAQNAIFIGWWRNQIYRRPRGSEIYKVYWDGTLTDEEKKWVLEVKEEYDYDIDDEQIAWWRWKLYETCKGDEQEMFEKYPPTAEYAFIMTGSQFFSSQRLTDCRKVVRDKDYDINRFFFGSAFEDTTLIECNEATATLKIWEHPKPRAQYVIGADPAWGSSEWADRFCINVTRCWADGMEQVAEFCTADMNTTQYAWALLYIAAAYGDQKIGAHSMINLEINGPGQAVWTEIQSLKRIAGMMKDRADVAMMLQNIENYLYKRIDSIGGGYNYHTKTSSMEKERFMNILKDSHEMGMLVINSVDCLDEMKNVVREDGMIGVPGRGKDDRVIAQALAVITWTDFLRVRLIQNNITKKRQKEQDNTMPGEYIDAGRNISNFLKTAGLIPRGFDVRGPR